MKGKVQTVIALLLVISIIAGGIVLVFELNRDSYAIDISLPALSVDIEVHISGEVQNPGLYLLPEEARMADLVVAAGGLTTAADSTAVNPAAILRDGAQIHVPTEGESVQKININTAEAWLLDALPGIGETLAERIVWFRVENGPFSCIDDLKNVEGIRQSTIEKIRDKIALR